MKITKGKLMSLFLLGAILLGCEGGFDGNTYEIEQTVEEQPNGLFRIRVGLGNEADEITCALQSGFDSDVIEHIETDIDVTPTEGNSKGNIYFVFQAVNEGWTDVFIDCTNDAIGGINRTKNYVNTVFVGDGPFAMPITN